MGLDPSDLDRPDDRPSVFWLWPEHLGALQLWCAVQTQWRRAGMEGVPVGLDYAGVEVVMRQRCGQPRKRRALFADLQVMESAALAAWAEKRAAEAR